MNRPSCPDSHGHWFLILCPPGLGLQASTGLSSAQVISSVLGVLRVAWKARALGSRPLRRLPPSDQPVESDGRDPVLMGRGPTVTPGVEDGSQEPGGWQGWEGRGGGAGRKQ